MALLKSLFGAVTALVFFHGGALAQAQTADDLYGVSSLTDIEYMGLQRAFDLTGDANDLFAEGNYEEAARKLLLVERSWLDGLDVDSATLAELVVAYIAYDLMEEIHWTRMDWTKQSLAADGMIEIATKKLSMSALLSDQEKFEMEGDLQTALDRKADGLFERGDLEEALTYYRRSEARALDTLQADPDNPDKRRNVWISRGKIANVICDMSLDDACIEEQKAVLKELNEDILPNIDSDYLRYDDITVTLGQVSQYLRLLGRNEEALTFSQRNFEHGTEFLNAYETDIKARWTYLLNASDLIDLYLVEGQIDQAEYYATIAMDKLDQWYPDGKYADGLARNIFWLIANDGAVAHETGRSEQACDAYERALQINEENELDIIIPSLALKPSEKFSSAMEDWLVWTDCAAKRNRD